MLITAVRLCTFTYVKNAVFSILILFLSNEGKSLTSETNNNIMNTDIFKKIIPMGVIMKFEFAHNNFNVMNLEKSLAFYKEALGLVEDRRMEKADGSFTIVYLGDGTTRHLLELTWLRDWEKESYDLGDNEFHLALKVDDMEKAHALHEKMGCICFENKAMGIYFITDPDGYWIEIVPMK